jgi:hypothetical protein
MSVDQQHPDATPGIPAELKAVESGLKVLWERARRASEVIRGLREEKRELLEKLVGLERDVARLQQELLKKEQALRAMAASSEEAARSKAVFFADGEREILAGKIRTLLAKLDAYL